MRHVLDGLPRMMPTRIHSLTNATAMRTSMTTPAKIAVTPINRLFIFFCFTLPP